MDVITLKVPPYFPFSACPVELRSKRSPSCNETTRKRQIAWFEKVPVDCKCEWQPITSAAVLRTRGLPSFEWCSCPDPMEVDFKCRPTGSDQYLHQRTLVKYQRQGGDCIPVRETLYSNFSCKEGTHTYKYGRKSAVIHLLISSTNFPPNYLIKPHKSITKSKAIWTSH